MGSDYKSVLMDFVIVVWRIWKRLYLEEVQHYISYFTFNFNSDNDNNIQDVGRYIKRYGMNPL